MSTFIKHGSTEFEVLRKAREVMLGMKSPGMDINDPETWVKLWLYYEARDSLLQLTYAFHSMATREDLADLLGIYSRCLSRYGQMLNETGNSMVYDVVAEVIESLHSRLERED